MKIIGIGNALVDVLVQLEDDSLLNKLGLPRGGMQLINDNQQKEIGRLLKTLNPQKATGGSAGNAILALAKLGAEPGFIGRIGRDEMGDFFLNCSKERGIDARLAIGEGQSGVANTFISKDGERTFATHLGEAAKLTAEDVTPDMLHGYDILHIEGYLVQNHDLIESVARLAKEQGIQISIDLASYNIVREDLEFFRYLVKEYVDIVFANEEESAAFTQGKEPEEALREIATMCKVAVVKLGKRGSSAMMDGHVALEGGNNVKVIDTTAAGDFFAGGFLHAYSRGWSLERCLKTGTMLSGQVIQVIGTQVSEEAWEDLRLKIEN